MNNRKLYTDEQCDAVMKLLSSGCWMYAAAIHQQLNIPPRTMRDMCKRTGLMVSSNLGYKHLLHATPDEIVHYYNRLVKQAAQMVEHADIMFNTAQQLHSEEISH